MKPTGIGRPNIQHRPLAAAGLRRMRDDHGAWRAAAHERDQCRHGARQEKREPEPEQRQQIPAGPSSTTAPTWISGEPLGQRSDSWLVRPGVTARADRTARTPPSVLVGVRQQREEARALHRIDSWRWYFDRVPVMRLGTILPVSVM
jgi:hypothetical protein